MVSEVQRTWAMDSFELQDSINYPHGGIQNTMQRCWKLNVMEESVEGHDSHVVTSNFKVKFSSFQTFYGAMI